MSQFRNCAVTLFDTCISEFDRLLAILKGNVLPVRVQFMVGQMEKCPTSSRRHLQVYVQWSTKVTLNIAKKLLGSTSHVEPAHGLPEENVTYCTKNDTRICGPWNLGSMKTGAMTKPESIMEMMAAVGDGGSDIHIADSFPRLWLIYWRSLVVYRSLKISPRNFKTKVFVYWGRTGVGKSRLAHLLASDPWIWTGTTWFDGYVGHRDVIMDDFRDEDLPIQTVLRLFDRYPMQVPVKGSFVPWCPRRIFVTSNLGPECLYAMAHPDQKAAFMRRLTEVFQIQ